MTEIQLTELRKKLFEQASNNNANAIADNAFEMFPTETMTFHAGGEKTITNDDGSQSTIQKKPGYWFTEPTTGKQLWVGLSNSLMEFWLSGELTKEQILLLPIYFNDKIEDRNGKQMFEADGVTPQHRLTFGVHRTKGTELSKLDKSKIKEFKKPTESDFDEFAIM